MEAKHKSNISRKQKDTSNLIKKDTKANEPFEKSLSELRDQTTSVDGLEYLSRISMSIMSQGFNQLKAKEPTLHLFHLEILQAFTLSRKRKKSDFGTDYPAVTERIIHLIEQNTKAYQEKGEIKTSTDEDENRQHEMLSLIRRWTLAVRGPRQGFQTRQYASELATQINNSFRHHYGCEATEIVAALSKIVNLFEIRIQAHVEDMRSWMSRKKSTKAMLKAFIRKLNRDEQEYILSRTRAFQHNRKQLFSLLWNINEQRWSRLFHFSYSELVATAPTGQQQSIISALRQLSIEFGEINDSDLKYLHLKNPIQHRPLIKLDDDTFFCASPQIVGIHLAEIIELLCARKPTLKKTAERARADWLEAQLSTVVRKHLRHADVRERVKWSDDNGVTTWETDLLAIVDKTALIFEAKSAKLSAPARRGALTSLKKALHELVVAPSEQSARLKNRILGASGTLTFNTRQGPLTLQPNDVRNIVRVNIVQDTVGPLSSHWPQLKRAGFVREDADLAPTMSVFDLETVFELLPREVERHHYLMRRAELERNTTYTADELDLLTLYLETRFNIGEDEHDGIHRNWYGLSNTLKYVSDKSVGVKLSSKSAATTELWSNILTALETKLPVGWTRFGHRLLNVDISQQREIEKLMRTGLRKTRGKPHLFFHTGITFGTTNKKQTIAVAVGAPVLPEQFEHNLMTCAESALDQGGQDDVLVLYWFTPRTSEPYDFIGVIKRQRFQEPPIQLSPPEEEF